jgi:mannose-6-phosphate isomerase
MAAQDQRIRLNFPFLVEPWFSPRIWGTRDLSGWYPGKTALPEPVGEAWLTGPQSQALLPGARRELDALVREHAGELMGQEWREAREFPLLIKLLFPHDRLSVQVHPGDDYARRHGLGRGKTEMWYVLEAAPGAKLGIHLVPGASVEDLRRACEDGTAAELLEWIEVRAGDTIFLPAGTIHAIGPGMVLAEVQQQSDNTFRLYDYDRLDATGKKRPLHLEHGLAVAEPRTRGGLVNRAAPRGEPGLLVESAYFRTELDVIHEGSQLEFAQGFRTLVLLEGKARLEWGGPGSGGAIELTRAHALVIPAVAGATRLTGSGKLLRVTLPRD